MTEEALPVTRAHRMLAAVGGAAVLLLAVMPAASAHVTVNPGEAEQGGFAKLAFRVPNERDDAGTTTVEINFPTDHPIPFVSVKPHEGWTYSVERTTLDEPVEAFGEEVTEVVSKVTFTGGLIRPGEFDEFEVSAGPLPDDTDQLLFPTLQTYAGGEIVRWIEETPASGEEPEHPAPLLRLVAGSDGEDGDTTATTAAGNETASGVMLSNTASQDDVDSAQTLATVALVLGALGLIAGAFGVARGRRSS